MKKNIFRRGMSGLLAVLMTFTALMSIGTTTAFAASTAGETAESYSVGFPRDGDANLDYSGTWGHDELHYMNGWTSGEATWMTTLHTIGSFDGQACYCIEPGVPRLLGKTYSRHGEDYWKNYPSDCNSTIDADTIKTLLGRIMQYGYQGNLSTSWRSQNDADADKMAHMMATQALVWETVVGERDANFNHADPGSADAVKSVYRTTHPLYSRFSAYYDSIEASVQKHTIVPSFMAKSTGKAQTVELNWDGSSYSATLTDTNGVLGNYRFSANQTGVSFSVQGNVLTISTQNAPTGTLRVTAEKEALRKGVVVWSGIFLILCWAGACLCGIFTRKRAYWKEQTLTSMLIRWKNQHELHMGKDFVSLVKGIMKRLKKLVRKQYDALTHIDFRDKTHKAILRIVIVNFVILVVVELVSLMCGFEFYALVIYSIVLFLILRKFFRDVQRKYQMLLHATNELAEGNLDVVIEGDAGVFMPIQKELCRIQQGFKKAVDEEVKNERMKTELVTNVSHDLRTPLTAIITYTDLLKNETDPEKQKEYIEVLERKSFRLKVLIEDLFEISKAASKSVKMNYMQVDLVGLIRQVELENDSKIQDAKLEFRWKLPDHKVIMWLDSEKTYRIFENLIVNITKYAMAQTRVYIEMKEFPDKVSISMKNVSATELDFDVNEITDRFVRGDSSRNTEGSGLGLAIAKSFIELQHGTLQITTEADLFKAEIVLPRLSEGQTGQNHDTSVKSKADV